LLYKGYIIAKEAEPMDNHARLLAVEVLLCDPEELHDDPLETELYIYRDRLRAGLATKGA
jgi:hypothetical protein